VGSQAALSIVIPAYNEEGRLPATLAEIVAFLQRPEMAGRGCELILVDDGSQDGTLALMREQAARLPGVRVVAGARNRGKGAAVAAGVAESSGALVLITDADLSTPIEEYFKLRRRIDQGADVAIGSRGLKGSVIEIPQPVYRVLMGKVFNLIVQVLLLPGLWDTQCGFKLFQGEPAREIFALLRTDGFAFDVEALHRARCSGLAVAEVPVRWRHSAPTKVSALRHSLDMFKDVLKIRLGL